MCCFPQSPNKVRTAPCSQQQSSSWDWCFAGEPVFCVSVSVCTRIGGGGSYSPSNHLLLQFRKETPETKVVCVQKCVCVCRFQTVPPPAGFVRAGFPSSSFNPKCCSETACSSPFPSSPSLAPALLCLGFVNRSLLM